MQVPNKVAYSAHENGPYVYCILPYCMRFLTACLQVPNKVAYSAHENGPYVYWHAFFNATTFPKNMVPIYRAAWGQVQEKGIAPVWVGHFGSAYRLTNTRKDGIERTNFRTLVAYMRQVRPQRNSAVCCSFLPPCFDHTQEKNPPPCDFFC